MKSYWNSLRPFEKRVVVGAGALLFLVLNFVFVFPHFSDLAVMESRRGEAEKKLRRYQTEIAQTNTYVQGLRDLEGREGADVSAEEQSYQFANAIQTQAAQSGVTPLSNGKILTQTNQFFIEKSQSISVQGAEEHLVDFLFSLGSGASMIRVRDLGLRPDPPRQQLVANVKLVASYQKKVAPKPTATAGRVTGPATPPVKSSPSTAQAESVTAKPAPSTVKRP